MSTSPVLSIQKAAIFRSVEGGFTLFYASGARLSGHCVSVEMCCIAAGLLVIDSRMVAFEDVVHLAVRGRW